jgi:hypothetical protein
LKKIWQMGRRGVHRGASGASGGVLTYEGFIQFWSGLEGIMEKVSEQRGDEVGIGSDQITITKLKILGLDMLIK